MTESKTTAWVIEINGYLLGPFDSSMAAHQYANQVIEGLAYAVRSMEQP